MNIRPFQIQDMNDLIHLWNVSLTHHPIHMEQLNSILFSDDNYQNDTIIIAEEGKEILGFCIGIKRMYPFLEKGLEEGRGWILNIVVKNSYRRQGIGTRLLNQMEQQLGCQHISLATYSPYYFFAGVDETYREAIEFFKHHHYQRLVCAYPMEIDLNGYEMPLEIKQRKQEKEYEGYSFHPFIWSDGPSLLKFIKHNFSTGWRYHVMMAMRKKHIEQDVILCKKEGNIVGYVQCAIDGDITRYGPFGVDSTLRNLGIGSILVHEMWMMMKQHGAKKAWFHSTDEAGRRFYLRHGMQVQHILYHYEKSLQL